MDAKKVVPLVLVAGGVAVLARKLGPRMESSMDWGRMIERMPDDAPPKWMINNIGALREENERILEQNERILDGLQRLGQEHGELPGARGGGDGGDD
jgi:hypothetical protein